MVRAPPMILLYTGILHSFFWRILETRTWPSSSGGTVLEFAGLVRLPYVLKNPARQDIGW